jgi:hypothetical protein
MILESASWDGKREYETNENKRNKRKKIKFRLFRLFSFVSYLGFSVGCHNITFTDGTWGHAESLPSHRQQPYQTWTR